MAGFGYHENISFNGNDWDLDAVVRFAYGDLLPQLPPTNENPVARFLPQPSPPTDVVPFTPSFLLQQPQEEQLLHDEMPPADAVDLPPPTDPIAVVVGGGPGQGVFAAPEPQLEDLPDFADWDLDPLLKQEDLYGSSMFDPLFPDMNVTVMTTEPSSGGGGAAGSTSRSRKRRNYRMVTRVLDGAPPPDTCSWRKYGQKSIKGSPNPRSYYRCSTDKQCKARKYVQRCGDDPRYLVVSYTRDHSHTEPLVRTRVVTANTTVVKPPPLPPSPFANIAAVALQAPAPPPTASLSLPATPVRSPSGDFFNDAFDVYVDMTPEEDSVPFTMLDLYDEPLDGLLFYTADELAPVGGGGGDNNLTFPMPYDYCEIAGGSSSGSDGSTASTAVGTGTAPVANVVDEMFYLESWDISLWDD